MRVYVQKMSSYLDVSFSGSRKQDLAFDIGDFSEKQTVNVSKMTVLVDARLWNAVPRYLILGLVCM